MRSGKFAKGKRAYAISDIGGHRVPYRKLKTQWDGLRVDAEEYSPKHPQLDPPRQIVDAVNQVGATPSSLIAIIEALKSSGSLRAELVII